MLVPCSRACQWKQQAKGPCLVIHDVQYEDLVNVTSASWSASISPYTKKQPRAIHFTV